MRITFIGLTITSSWGNGHATTYRGLVRELCRRGHEVLFLEHDKPWYAAHRDLPHPPFGRTVLYDNVETLTSRHAAEVRETDAVVVGSYVPQGVEVGRWAQQTAGGVVAFYDIDTPVTLAKLERGDHEYLSPELIPGYGVYLSFAGGRALQILESRYRSPRAVPLYCSVDPQQYFPQPAAPAYDLGYLGTYSADRQPPLETLLLEPARQWEGGHFCVAGPQYPPKIRWPTNVARIEHLPPAEHRDFYNRQRFTLNVTRQDMKRLGHSPSVRLFEAAACGVPVISDRWEGIKELFPEHDAIFLADTADDVLPLLKDLPDEHRRRVGERARQIVLEGHTATHRAAELERHLREAGA